MCSSSRKLHSFHPFQFNRVVNFFKWSETAVQEYRYDVNLQFISEYLEEKTVKYNLKPVALDLFGGFTTLTVDHMGRERRLS
jgi:hypothetical protein